MNKINSLTLKLTCMVVIAAIAAIASFIVVYITADMFLSSKFADGNIEKEQR